MDHTQKLTHISLCTGYGGIDLGLSRALSGAIRTISYVEIEAFAISNLVSKIEDGHLDTAPIYSDLKTFPWRSFRGRVDIVSGGFPCQPFSTAGKRAGDADPRHLFPYIINGLRELGRPPLIFLENVEGIISSKLKGDEWSDPEGTPVLLHVLRELERLGYNSAAGVFSAREVGAPHQRKRVFIMACRSDLGESGRALVSGLLDRGGGSSTAYPAPRGAEQLPWEPPRVTVGDADMREQGASKSESVLLQKTNREGKTDRSQRSNDTRRATPCITVGDAHSQRSQGAAKADRRENRALSSRSASSLCIGLQGQAQPAMGGSIDGHSHRVDYAELCEAVDNRTDELRLLGNGVIPNTASRAFCELWSRLVNTSG